MEDRRTFLKTTIGALGAAATARLSAEARVKGANNRIRLAVIGCGSRSGRVFDAFARHTEVEWLAGCEVNPARLQSFMTPARQSLKLQMATDYRRILNRKDIDAVLIGTTDFSHAETTVDAISAGKDVYVEKPAANTIEGINAMLEASRASKQIIQIGTEQRSGDHFVEAKKIVESGVLGNIRHVAIVQPGSAPIGGLGGHHVDIAHWFMNADHAVPHRTAAIGLFLNTQNPDAEQLPDTFSISWEYDNFVMTFANGDVPRPQDDIGSCGTFFIGGNGSLQVNRMGYALRPPMPRTTRNDGRLPPATKSDVNRGGATQVGRNICVNTHKGADADGALHAHVKNFLDCVRSRRAPNAHMEIGYHSELPCLLALEAMRQNKVLEWDAATRTSKALSRAPRAT